MRKTKETKKRKSYTMSSDMYQFAWENQNLNQRQQTIPPEAPNQNFIQSFQHPLHHHNHRQLDLQQIHQVLGNRHLAQVETFGSAPCLCDCPMRLLNYQVDRS